VADSNLEIHFELRLTISTSLVVTHPSHSLLCDWFIFSKWIDIVECIRLVLFSRLKGDPFLVIGACTIHLNNHYVEVLVARYSNCSLDQLWDSVI
jgi:hypothetical protein